MESSFCSLVVVLSGVRRHFFPSPQKASQELASSIGFLPFSTRLTLQSQEPDKDARSQSKDYHRNHREEALRRESWSRRTSGEPQVRDEGLSKSRLRFSADSCGPASWELRPRRKVHIRRMGQEAEETQGGRTSLFTQHGADIDIIESSKTWLTGLP